LNILAVSAHPDDAEYGCFGTLAKLKKEGNQIRVLYMTLGEGGGDPVVRRKESEDSCALIGAFSYYADFKVVEMSEVKAVIIDAIKRVMDITKADCIYVNSPCDTHQIHRTVAQSARVAARGVDQILYYETPSTTVDFAPRMYVDITDTINLKLQCLKAHNSQVEIRDYLSEDVLKTVAHYWYLKGNIDKKQRGGCAEAFVVERQILR